MYMLQKCFKFAAIALAVLFTLLCFMPHSTSPMEALTPATSLVLNLAGVSLLVTGVSGVLLLINRYLLPKKPGPTSFN